MRYTILVHDVCGDMLVLKYDLINTMHKMDAKQVEMI